MRLGKRYGEIELPIPVVVIQRWRGSSGNVRLSHLLTRFLLLYAIRKAQHSLHGKHYVFICPGFQLAIPCPHRPGRRASESI